MDEEAAAQFIQSLRHLTVSPAAFFRAVATATLDLHSSPMSRQGAVSVMLNELIDTGSYTVIVRPNRDQIWAQGVQLEISTQDYELISSTRSLDWLRGHSGWDDKSIEQAMRSGEVESVEVLGQLRFPKHQFVDGTAEAKSWLL
ncbi:MULTISPECIES: hypothetical protein [unclassified Frigoribacterium]|uniref:hypothetical protein n=1 Tax=unclassified Frigoribacterium TaxID=2627005 RepID=UPI001565D592|nr:MULTISPECIES: hypothetical protein [unclassified Frigoribacterium]NQW87670.1 hypothetical protein [Frigoribacterium sp. VKM Ac-2860]NQX09521.1 hypothetical protein [Frigoribacterium sp. VKM Ac-2859]